MKKIGTVIILFIGIFSNTIQCQTFERFSKGTVYTGGSVSFKSEEFEDINSLHSYKHYYNTLDSEISIGYLIWDKFSLGANLVYYYESQAFDTRSNPDKNVTKDLLLGPVIKYYSKYNLFAFASFAYGISKYGYDDSLVEWRTTLWNAGIGYSLMLNKTVAVEPQIMYRVIEKKDQALIEGTEIFKSFIFSIGFQFYFHNSDN